MTENPLPLSICKEEPESNVAIKKLLKRKNSIIKKNFVTKKSLRHSLDISGLIKKRTFQLQKPSSNPNSTKKTTKNYHPSQIKGISITDPFFNPCRFMFKSIRNFAKIKR